MPLFGGTTPREQTAYPAARKPKKQASYATNKQFLGILALCFTPWIFFSVILCLFVFLYHELYEVAWIVAIALIAISIVWIVSDVMTVTGGQFYVFFGVLSIVACLAGVFVGLYVYYGWIWHYWKIEGLRVYKNVLPAEPAASHADAGKIIFSEDSRVDMTKAVGFQAGHVYCVAPVRDDSEPARVNYWAAGMDCCAARANFNCDDAWDTTARSGTVILDHGYTISFSHRDFYLKAVKEAEALYDVASADKPIFVRWVKDANAVQGEFYTLGTQFTAGAIAVYLPISIVLGAVMSYAYQKRKTAQEDEEKMRL